VSRRSFRAHVGDPRPTSAWAMVIVASATLWITEQLAVWTMVTQTLAIALSFWRRKCPFAWQRSDLALNIGMLLITGTTIQVALQGGPSTLGLAHFAALSQGLQLLDARPRKTEFLLVALALFQVVLASNLTDSVLFTPLLLVFLLSTVWTLLVHTIRSEALEADDPSASRALTPGLLRVTLFASGASVVLALMLFMVLPRLHSSILKGSSLGPMLATAGFSDTVALGALGAIRQDSTIVLRVETLEGNPPGPSDAYWSGLAFDHFNGESWSVSPKLKYGVGGAPELGVLLGERDTSPKLVQRIIREPVTGSVLFGTGLRRALRGSIRTLERDVNGGLYAAGQSGDRLRYTITTERQRKDHAALRDDTTAPPMRDGDRYLQLPTLTPEISELANSITAGMTTDADRIAALETHLLIAGRYSDTPPQVDARSGRSALEAFLFDDMSAHCEYYATALVVLARSLGIPARLVNGFAGGRLNKIGGFVELTRSDAHAWVEVHYAQHGWVRYDATPPDLRQRAEPLLSIATQMAQLASAIEYWWFQRIVGFDRSDQMHALKSAWLAWRSFRGTGDEAASATKPEIWRVDKGGTFQWRNEFWAVVVLLVVLAAVWKIRRDRSSDDVPHYYRAALRILARRGLVRAPTVSARDFLQRVVESQPGPAAAAFAQLTENYLAERFGDSAPPNMGTALVALRSSARRVTSSGPNHQPVADIASMGSAKTAPKSRIARPWQGNSELTDQSAP
jgi:transglutaminase-like putative cysteine protease